MNNDWKDNPIFSPWSWALYGFLFGAFLTQNMGSSILIGITFGILSCWMHAGEV